MSDNYIDEGVYQDFLPYALEHNIKVSAITEGYNQCDLILNGKYTAEIKRRRKGYTSTNELILKDGALIEESKYKYLNETVTVSGYSKGYYVMLFADGVGYAFTVTDMPYDELKWNDKYCPKTTDFNRRNKIKKRTASIPLSKGKRFIYNQKLYDEYRDN